MSKDKETHNEDQNDKPTNGNSEMNSEGNVDELEKRALSVFSSERSEDITALVLSLVTTFIVLLFTKWL